MADVANRVPADSDLWPPGFPRSEREERVRIAARIREARKQKRVKYQQIDPRDARARGQQIVDLWHSGATMAGIARALKIHVATAQKWIRWGGIHRAENCPEPRCVKETKRRLKVSEAAATRA